MPFQTKRSGSRPLRSPSIKGEKNKERYKDFDHESIVDDSTEHQLFQFRYGGDWLDNRKIPVTAFTKEHGKLQQILYLET